MSAKRGYYFAVSAVLRSYLEGRFLLNATDLTTEEILLGLDELPVENEDRARIRRFLADSDLVKFAASVPTEGDIRETHERALRFVESTRLIADEAGVPA